MSYDLFVSSLWKFQLENEIAIEYLSRMCFIVVQIKNKEKELSLV